MALVLLGPPGAGKGTQARKLSVALKFPSISTGDILRDAVQNQTELGRKAQAYMESGSLVPDQLVDAIVANRLERSDCRDGVILDGYPRTIHQAEVLEKLFSSARSILAIGIRVSKDILLERLAGRWSCPNCGKVFNVSNLPAGRRCDECSTGLVNRKDDTAAVIEERLQVYDRSTAPLIDFYRSRDAYVEVDGERTVDDIHERILKVLEARSENLAATI
jgi:adenylate kinase